MGYAEVQKWECVLWSGAPYSAKNTVIMICLINHNWLSVGHISAKKKKLKCVEFAYLLFSCNAGVPNPWAADLICTCGDLGCMQNHSPPSPSPIRGKIDFQNMIPGTKKVGGGALFYCPPFFIINFSYRFCSKLHCFPLWYSRNISFFLGLVSALATWLEWSSTCLFPTAIITHGQLLKHCHDFSCWQDISETEWRKPFPWHVQ